MGKKPKTEPLHMLRLWRNIRFPSLLYPSPHDPSDHTYDIMLLITQMI